MTKTLLLALVFSAAANTAPAAATRDTAQSAFDAARHSVESCTDDESKRKAAGLLLKAKTALDQGRFADAQKLAGDARATAENAITRISVIVDSNSGETRIVVQHGAVEVSAGGQTAVAHPGEMVRAGGGISPRVVEARIGVPSPAEPEDGGTLRAADGRLRWARVEGAHRYSVTVARDGAFRDRVATVETDGTSATLGPGLTEGNYHWRVVAITADGVESMPSAPRRFRLDNGAPVAAGPGRVYWLRDHHCDANEDCGAWVAVDMETGAEREVHDVDLKALSLDAARESATREKLLHGELAVHGTFRDGASRKTVLVVADVQGRR